MDILDRLTKQMNFLFESISDLREEQDRKEKKYLDDYLITRYETDFQWLLKVHDRYTCYKYMLQEVQFLKEILVDVVNGLNTHGKDFISKPDNWINYIRTQTLSSLQTIEQVNLMEDVLLQFKQYLKDFPKD